MGVRVTQSDLMVFRRALKPRLIVWKKNCEGQKDEMRSGSKWLQPSERPPAKPKFHGTSSLSLRCSSKIRRIIYNNKHFSLITVWTWNTHRGKGTQTWQTFFSLSLSLYGGKQEQRKLNFSPRPSIWSRCGWQFFFLKVLDGFIHVLLWERRTFSFLSTAYRLH